MPNDATRKHESDFATAFLERSSAAGIALVGSIAWRTLVHRARTTGFRSESSVVADVVRP